MEVKRTIKVNTDQFEVGDVIKFKLADGEKVQARAVKQTSIGMLFVLVDCLAKEYPMFESMEDMTEDYFTYENSDLRKALNGEILARFPEEIRSRMVAPQRAWRSSPYSHRAGNLRRECLRTA